MTATPPLPAEGGSYIRTEKGELVPARQEPGKAPHKPAVKEG